MPWIKSLRKKVQQDVREQRAAEQEQEQRWQEQEQRRLEQERKFNKWLEAQVKKCTTDILKHPQISNLFKELRREGFRVKSKKGYLHPDLEVKYSDRKVYVGSGSHTLVRLVHISHYKEHRTTEHGAGYGGPIKTVKVPYYVTYGLRLDIPKLELLVVIYPGVEQDSHELRMSCRWNHHKLEGKTVDTFGQLYDLLKEVVADQIKRYEWKHG